MRVGLVRASKVAQVLRDEAAAAQASLALEQQEKEAALQQRLRELALKGDEDRLAREACLHRARTDELVALLDRLAKAGVELNTFLPAVVKSGGALAGIVERVREAVEMD